MDTVKEEAFDQANARTVASLYACMADIPRNPKNARLKLQTMTTILDNIPEEDRLNALIREAEKPSRLGETVLHTAIKLFSCKSDVEKEIIELYVSRFPKLILQDRGDTEYGGQTPLHMAVCKGNIWMVNVILQELSKKENKHSKATLLKKKANGSIFHNTVMMGELPLSIAALGFNKGVFDMLLDKGADMDGVNIFGDTVCHTLVKYAYLYKEKLSETLEMCRYISEDPTPNETNTKDAINRKLRKKIWVMENAEGLNPLQLSAKLGQHELFGFIINLEVYCWDNSKDGLFDIKVHDVTELDAITSMTPDEITGADSKALRKTMPENVPVRVVTKTRQKTFTKSILMILLELEPAVAFQFLQFPTLRRIIDKKWIAYRFWFFLWWVIHITFICFLTWYAVERAQQNYNNGSNYDVNLLPNFKKRTSQDAFVTTLGVIALLMSLIYFAQEILRVTIGKMPWTFKSFVNPYSNGSFRVIFLLMSLCLVIDFIVSIWSDSYENYCLIIAVIIGWFSIIFFLRVIRPFSFFTVLILKVLIGDMLRFFVVLALELLAFSTAMYMVIQGSDVIDDTDFSNFGRVLFSMFKLMVGLGEVAALYNTRHPALAILIFTGFLIMTTLLMLNSLIALMSKTCSELVENVGNISALNRHCKLQRLSAILFIESILPNRMLFNVGKEVEVFRYNNIIHRRKKMKRYMLEVRSLQDEADDGSAEVESNWGFRTAVLNALGNKHALLGNSERPLSGVSDKVRQLFRRKSGRKQKTPRPKRGADSRDGVEKDQGDILEIPVVPETANLAYGNLHQMDAFQSDRPPKPPAVLEIYNVSTCDHCNSTIESLDQSERIQS